MSEPTRRGLPPRPVSQPAKSNTPPSTQEDQAHAPRPLPRPVRPGNTPVMPTPSRRSLPTAPQRPAPKPVAHPEQLARPNNPAAIPTSRPVPASQRTQSTMPATQRTQPQPQPQEYASETYAREQHYPQQSPTGTYQQGPIPIDARYQGYPSHTPTKKGPNKWVLIGGSSAAVVVMAAGMFFVPNLVGGGSDQVIGIDDGGKGTSISAVEKITAEDIPTNYYYPLDSDNGNVESDVSVHRWSFDWGANDYDADAYTEFGYSNDTHTAYGFLNTFAAKSINDETVFKDQVSQIAAEIDAQYGLGGIKGMSEIETNHSGDYRIGVYHNGGGEHGGIEAMTIFNISGNRIVAGTVTLLDESGRMDYGQMATSFLEVKAISD